MSKWPYTLRVEIIVILSNVQWFKIELIRVLKLVLDPSQVVQKDFPINACAIIQISGHNQVAKIKRMCRMSKRAISVSYQCFDA